MGWIYLIMNNLNGKCYVGQTKYKDPTKRWKQHVWTRNDPVNRGVLARSLAKHGPESFTFTPLVELPDDQLDAREIDEIEARNTMAPRGYNLSGGGQNIKFRPHHPLTKLRMSSAQKGKPKGPMSAETKAKLSAIRKAAPKRTMTDEQKARFKGVQMGAKSTSSKKVDQYTMDGVFVKTHDAIKRAEAAIGTRGISRVCKGTALSIGGFKWRYHGEAFDSFIYEPPRKELTPAQAAQKKATTNAWRKANADLVKQQKRESYQRNRDANNAKRRAAPKKPRKPMTEEQKAKRREAYHRTKALKNNLVSVNKE
jgi:group I intron endonuclease